MAKCFFLASIYVSDWEINLTCGVKRSLVKVSKINNQKEKTNIKLVTDLPFPDKTSPTIKQHKTANTLILLKPEDVIVKSSWLLLWWILHLRNLPCVNLKIAAVWNINHSCLESKYFRLCFMVMKVITLLENLTNTGDFSYLVHVYTQLTLKRYWK